MNIDSKEFAQLLHDNGLMKISDNPNDLLHTPEFQLLRILLRYSELSTTEVDEKYEAPVSISMLLSNLQADNLIEQTKNYKWKISSKIEKAIQEYLDRSNEVKEVVDEDKLTEDIENKKIDYFQMVNVLEGSSYIPSIYNSIEDLFNIPELELLVLIKNNQPVNTDTLEKLYKSGSPLSLTLSNLKADELIKQDKLYRWILSDKISEKLQSVSKPTQEEIEDINLPSTISNLDLIDNKQFIKAIMEHELFKSRPLTEIFSTDEFKVLYLINLMSPIDQKDLEDKLDIESSLTLVLSNLKIDGLIDQQNDYRWILSEALQQKIKHIKISSSEFKDEIDNLLKIERELTLKKESRDEISKKEEPKKEETDKETESEPLIEDKTAVDLEVHDEELTNKEINTSSIEVSEDIKSEDSDEETKVEDVIQNKAEVEDNLEKIPQKPKKDIITEIKKILIKNKYISSMDIDNKELSLIPEFEIINILKDYDELSADELEEYINSEVSVSMSLSNLQADGIIEQTQNYKWKLSRDTLKLVTDLDNDELNLEKEELDRKRREEQLQKEKEKEEERKRLQQFITAAYKKGYIETDNEPIEKYLSTPEFEVLFIIKENEPINAQEIKEKAVSVSPVLISRTISKLEADNCIVSEPNLNYVLTEEFKYLIIEDELKEQEEQRKREQEEKLRKKREELKKDEQKFKILAEVLKDEGLSIHTFDIETLIKMPEFEILSIIAKLGRISLDKIKENAENTTPVIISRTLFQLENKGFIEKVSETEYELTIEFERKLRERFKLENK